MAGAAKDRLARRALVTVLVAGAVMTCASLGGVARPAAAQQLPGPEATPETPPTAPPDGAGLLPGLDPRLVGVALEYAPSSAEVRALNDASARLAALTAEQAALHARQGAIDARIVVLDEVQRRAIAELEAAESDRRRLTALVYSKGDTAWQAAALLQTEDAMDVQRVTQLGEDFSASLRAAMIRARLARKRATAESAALAIERVTVGERLGAVEQVELPAATREVATLSVHAAASVAGGAVAGLGIPLATLDAYLRAEAMLAGERPECGLRWWMLAGIGRVESNHGRFAGTQLVANGDTAPHIVGIPLDGDVGVATITDSDAGHVGRRPGVGPCRRADAVHPEHVAPLRRRCQRGRGAGSEQRVRRGSRRGALPLQRGRSPRGRRQPHPRLSRVQPLRRVCRERAEPRA